jgi:hypothetical protein
MVLPLVFCVVGSLKITGEGAVDVDVRAARERDQAERTAVEE